MKDRGLTQIEGLPLNEGQQRAYPLMKDRGLTWTEGRGLPLNEGQKALELY